MKTSYLVSGLMSGTSLDGVDIALCRIMLVDSHWKYEIIDGITIPYSEEIRKELAKAVHLSNKRIEELDVILARFYVRELIQFHKRNNVIPDIISSHGHTIFHEPNKGFTLQIGDGRKMAAKTGITVVNNFRKKDVEHGGQGAPLVPVGDRLLFGKYNICLNIGGIANLSYDQNGKRLAYDICPANMVLNYLSEKHGMQYDKNGAIAASGQCNNELLFKLNSLDYYTQKPPKTLGREWVEQMVWPILEESKISLTDKLTTASEHVALQISNSLKQIGGNSILASGGGALNSFLMKRIQSLSCIAIELPESNLIEYKESLVFGLLGVLRIRNEINCYASVTGASKDLCTGDLHLA